MPIEYGTLRNAHVSIDSDDGAVWLWITSGKEHAGINLSAQLTDPSIQEVVNQWSSQQNKPQQD